jgi:hypothetical protein
MGLRGTQLMGSIIYTLVSENQVFSSEEASRSLVSSKTELVTIGTLDTPEED